MVTQFNRTWVGEGDQRKEAPCCNNSVVAFTSKDTLTWTYSASEYASHRHRKCGNCFQGETSERLIVIAAVGAYDETRIYQEGPNECDVVLLNDKKTLWAVMRVDGGDG